MRAWLSSAIVSHEMRPVALSHPHARLASSYYARSQSLPLFWQPLSFLGGKEQRRVDGAQEKDADGPLFPLLQALPLTSLGLACWLGPLPLGCGRPLAAPARKVGVGPRNPGSEVGVVVSSLACGWPRAPCAPCAIPAGEGKTTSNAAASRPPSQRP